MALIKKNMKQRFISVISNKIIKNEAIEIWRDGSVVRDYIWVPDLANAFTELLCKNIWNTIFNIGGHNGYSLNEVIAFAEHVTSKTAQVTYMPAISVDVKCAVLDITKLKNEIIFTPLSLKEGMELYYKYLQHDYPQ
jgi:UDP-glucose 4-epimerase